MLKKTDNPCGKPITIESSSGSNAKEGLALSAIHGYDASCGL